MLVPQLLFETLEELIDDDLKTFKFYLSMEVLASCRPIPKSRLHSASRTETVTNMIESYGEESAVNITIEILMKMSFRRTANDLKSRYAEGRTATTSISSAAAPVAAPAIMAQQGSVIIAPAITGSTTGSLNITIKK